MVLVSFPDPFPKNREGVWQRDYNGVARGSLALEELTTVHVAGAGGRGTPANVARAECSQT